MKRIKSLRVVYILPICMIAILMIGYFISAYGLTVSEFELSSAKVSDPIRIVQLTDLHNSVFGFRNERLIKTIEDQDPDLILITGDLLDSGEETTDIANTLIESLAKIAPVYFSYGNHEKSYEALYKIDLAAVFEKAGATVLDYDYENIEINGQLLRIGGIYGYCRPASFLETNEADPEECTFLTDFQNTDSYTILLCHMPYCWLIDNGISEWDIDCVFAGHVHGGQVRIPVIGGLWAPDQGWFPGRECGLYYSDDGDKALVLSRGLGSTEYIPRFNNIPEIIVIDIVSEM